jgi:hypothetical protein
MLNLLEVLFLLFFNKLKWFELAGVNQQPPMHQLRVSPLKLFWG